MGRALLVAAGAVVVVLALLRAGLEMVEPLFMRYIVDRVLLNAGLDAPARLTRLNLAGATFLGVVILSNLINVLRDYRQRLLNARVMLSLRRSLFDRLLRLPLARLWEMKTGGILSRLTGDVDTTTGLLQMAVVSLVGGAFAVAFVIAVAYYGTIAAIRFGADPDTYGIPLVTSSVDFIGAIALIVVIVSVGIA